MQDGIVTATDEMAEESAFEAGFNGTDITPVAPEETGETPEVKSEPTPEPQVAEAPKALTEADMKAALDLFGSRFGGHLDKVFGTLGEVKQKIKELESLKEKATGISPKARERLSNEFPELAGLLFDTEDAASAPAIPAVETPKKEEEVVQPPPGNEVMSPEQIVERRLLKRDHPDWESVVQTPAFIAWTDTLAQADRDRIRETWDADYVSEKLTEFKAKMKELGESQAQNNQNKKTRLDAAVVPRGMPNQTEVVADDADEEAAMLKAFKSRR